MDASDINNIPILRGSVGASPMRKLFDIIRQGGRVQRFHCKPVIYQENVAEHSFYVAWVVWAYSNAVGREPSPKLLMACLQHDLAESVTGDMPSPTKRKLGKEAFNAFEAEVLDTFGMPDFAQDLDGPDTELLKWGDNLAGYMKCLQETQMGNRYLDRTRRNYLAYLQEQIVTTEYMDQEVMKQMIATVEGETDVH